MVTLPLVNRVLVPTALVELPSTIYYNTDARKSSDRRCARDSSELMTSERDETSKDSRRDALQKTIETVRARREALARETSATRRAVAAAAADKAEGSDAVELPRAARLAALRDAAARKRKAPADDDTRRIRVTRDARGDEQLELCGAPAEGASSVVMMAWERPYMEALVDALEVTPADTVLEIGYGLGFSCAAIQRRKPRRHVVVECDAGVRARIPDGVEVVAATCPHVGIALPHNADATASMTTFPSMSSRPSSSTTFPSSRRRRAAAGGAASSRPSYRTSRGPRSPRVVGRPPATRSGSGGAPRRLLARARHPLRADAARRLSRRVRGRGRPVLCRGYRL